jgi:hypothetical protein
MSVQRFTATIARSGNHSQIVLPFDPNEIWGARERHHVTGTVAGHRVRGPLSYHDERAVLPLGAAWRRQAGLADGMTVEVELEPEGPQLDALPEDVALALEAAPQAKAFFVALATFYRTTYLKWIAGARKPEARQARIAELVALLQAGKKQRERK